MVKGGNFKYRYSERHARKNGKYRYSKTDKQAEKKSMTKRKNQK
jgi:hypothetical protein